MQSLTEAVYHLDPPGGLFDQTVVLNLFPDRSVGARKLLINRALQYGEIIRLRQGLYCLERRFRRSHPHPFMIAATIHGPSHVSLESALAYHGLIPEAVYQVANVTTMRSREFYNPMGHFAYYRVPSITPRAGVKAIEISKQEWAFVATPIRAIVDIVYLRKIDWRKNGIAFLTESMRIEEDELASLDLTLLDEIMSGIQNYRVVEYMKNMTSEIRRC